jgi:MFS family permease
VTVDSRPSPHGVIGLTLVHQVLVSLVAATFPVLLPELVVRIGLSGSAAGLYVFVLYTGAVTATFLCERLFAALGAATASAVCVGLAAAAMLGILGASLPVIIAASLVIGVGYGPVTPASSHMLVSFVDRGRANFVYSLRQAGAPLGVLLAGLLVPPLVDAFGWRVAVATVAALAAVLTIVTLGRALAIDRYLGQPTAPQRRLIGPLREMLAVPRLRWLATTSFLFSTMLATVNAYVPFAAAELAGASLARAGLAAACAQAGAVVGRLAWGALADRLRVAGPVLVMLGISMAVAIGLLATVTPALPFAATAAICVALGATGAGWAGVVLAEAARLGPPGRVGSATAGLKVCNYLGVFVGPPIVGSLYALTGNLRIALAAVGLVGLAGGLVAFAAHRHEHIVRD